jgi:hypothetical protein
VNVPSKGGILVCEECGERMVLDCPLSVWSSGTISFGCECGERLTLADGLNQEGFGGAVLRTIRFLSRSRLLESGASKALWKFSSRRLE